MKRKLFYGFVCLVVIVLSISLISCGVSNTTNKGNTNSNEETNNNTNTDNSGNTGNSGSTDSNETINYPDPVSDTTITADETTADFTIVTDVENGYTIESNIVSITAPGEYTISGYLNGQILINTTDSVTLNLSNVTLEYSNDSPIKNIGKLLIVT